MENRNNALHYKMYKSGKSIVYAGLATTAALAGLVLANTNATAVHADATPATEQTATPAASTATSAQISAAQKAVSDASDQVTSASAAVTSAQSAVNSAEQLNSGVTAVNSANQVYKDALANQSNATSDWVDAVNSFQNANSAAQENIDFAAQHAGFDASSKNAASQATAFYNGVVSDNTAVASQSQSDYDAASASAKSLQTQYNVSSANAQDLSDKVGAIQAQMDAAAVAGDKDSLAVLGGTKQQLLNQLATANALTSKLQDELKKQQDIMAYYK